MKNENLISRIFTYIFLMVAVIISLWLSYKITNLSSFFLYGILGLIFSFIVLSTSLKLSIASSVSYNFVDLAFSLILLGLSVWSIFSCLKLWI